LIFPIGFPEFIADREGNFHLISCIYEVTPFF